MLAQRSGDRAVRRARCGGWPLPSHDAAAGPPPRGPSHDAAACELTPTIAPPRALGCVQHMQRRPTQRRWWGPSSFARRAAARPLCQAPSTTAATAAAGGGGPQAARPEVRWTVRRLRLFLLAGCASSRLRPDPVCPCAFRRQLLQSTWRPIRAAPAGDWGRLWRAAAAIPLLPYGLQRRRWARPVR